MKRYCLGLFLVVFFGLLLVLTVILMVFAGNEVRKSYAVPGEPDNAYLVHMIERGVNQKQVFCDLENQCVLLITPGIYLNPYISIKVDEAEYFPNHEIYGQVYSRGLYCPGAVDPMKCYVVADLSGGKACPKSAELYGFRAPLYKETCITEGEIQ